MHRNLGSVERRRCFQLLRGDGEAERLDRFLAAADPLQVALPVARSMRWGWGLKAFLELLALDLAVRRSGAEGGS